MKWYSTPSPNLSPYIFLGLDPSPPPLVTFVSSHLTKAKCKMHILTSCIRLLWLHLFVLNKRPRCILGKKVWQICVHLSHVFVYKGEEVRLVVRLTIFARLLRTSRLCRRRRAKSLGKRRHLRALLRWPTTSKSYKKMCLFAHQDVPLRILL